MAKIYRCRHEMRRVEVSYLRTALSSPKGSPCPPGHRTSESWEMVGLTGLIASVDGRPPFDSLKEKGVIAMGRDLDHDMGHGSHDARLLPLLANVFAEPGQGNGTNFQTLLHAKVTSHHSFPKCSLKKWFQ